MKRTFKYIFSALLVAGSLVACSPETFEGVNEAGIPEANAYGNSVKIDVDQSINQVCLKLDAPAVYPIWTITLPNGKQEKSTVNGYTKIFTNSGDYTVTVKVGNRDGISDGEYTTSFHINNSIVDFTKYTTMLSKAPWHIANKEKGHLACGEPGTDGTNWWSGDADCKLNEGVYDNELTFTSDFKYTFNPGDHGTIYVNKDVTIWPDLRNPDEDFCVPVETQNSEYGLEVDGDDLYLTFPKGTYFPYIANNDIWNTPKYKVVNLTTKKMTLLIDNGSISWQYILTTESTVEKPFTGFKYNSQFNLWKSIDDAQDYSTHYYYAPGWAQIADPEMSQDGSSYTWVLPEATTDQWQAQCPIKPTKLSLTTGATYDFSCIITSSEDLPGVTVKLTDVNTGDNYVFVERVPVKQYEDYVFYVSDVNNLTADADCELFFDFGGNPANTTITVKDIVVKDHANDDGTVLPTDEPEPVGPQIDWSGANLLKGMNVEISQYYADAGWAGYGDAEYTAENGTYTINYPYANKDQWQGQFTFNNTNIALDPEKIYDFRVKITSSTDHPGVTVKLTQQDNDNIYLTADRHAITAFEETWIELGSLKVNDGQISNLKIVYDFGGVAENTVITLSDMHLQEHKETAGAGGNNWNGANILAGMPVDLSQYYADANWSGYGDAEYTAENGTYTISYPYANKDQWQGQFTFNNTNISLDPEKHYDFRVKLVSTTDHPGVTVKLTQQDNDDIYLTADRHALAAYEETWVELTDLALNKEGQITNLKIVYDFGGVAENTEITISDMHLQEHGAAGGASKLDYNSSANLWKAVDAGDAFISVTPWFSPENWSGGLTPEWSHDGNVWEVTMPEGMGGSQWQGQFPINTTIAAEAAATYSFSVTLEADNECPGVTIKLTETDDVDGTKHDDNFFFADRHDVPAYEEWTYTVTGVKLAKADAHALSLFFDFGGTPVGTNVKISNIILVKE